MDVWQIVQKRISDGKETRVGEFANRLWAEQMAQMADTTHPDCVHWVELHPMPPAWVEEQDLCEGNAEEKSHVVRR